MGLGRPTRKLGRDTGERFALFRNQVSALLLHERIETTEAKAKEIKKIADRIVGMAMKGDLHAMREVRRFLTDKEAVKKLFTIIAPRYAGRQGGYTRVVKLGPRRGDAAPMAIVELVPAQPEARGS
ncbi:MAG: 50S ribosomal protein L17 [Armatimonadota bacterium]|nr:50S ribosomal protein L17 [Armatimonadota bacterium]MDR5702382.1 50S ribosomal protein L17 [Armatimonadota bacterium]MDR7435475.1 50S ribosomal protein L17 [Armatimonadota bacterium]